MGVSLAALVPGEAAAEESGVRVVSVPAQGNPDRPELLDWDRRALRGALADFRPDLIQLEEEPWARGSLRAAGEARRLGIPVIITAVSPEPAGFLIRRRARKTIRMARAGVGGNSHAAQYLRERLPGFPVAVIPRYGVPLPPPVNRPAREPLALGYAGRLLPDRGVDRLLRACAGLMGTWTLTIAGTGPEQENLELLAERLGLASRVRWLGGITRAGIESLWNELDCLVLPADPRAEGAERWSAILIEAMAYGVIPVVMKGGIPESLAGPAGRVAADEESLATALQTLRAYPAERPRLAQAARQRVLDHFGDPAIAARTLELWEEILARPG